MRAISLRFACVSLAALGSAACAGAEEPSAADLNAATPVTSASTTSSATSPTPGVTAPPSPDVVAPAMMGPIDEPEPVSGPGTAPPAAPATGDTPPASGGGAGPVVTVEPEPEAEPPSPGGGGAPPAGGGGAPPNPEPVASGGAVGDMGGMTGLPPEPMPVVEPVPEPMGVFDPRTGPFKALIYSKVGGFPHTDSINTGKVMLQEIADEQGFEAVFSDTNEDITPEGLAQYELVFFLNTTGDIFNETEQQTYEDWMTTNGAFAGVHSATDTENNWAFYSEVTGQYYDLHEPCCSLVNIQWDPDAADMVMVQGMPSPWPRSEEWYYFNRNAEWSAKAGFKILSRITSNNSTRPVSFVREWSNFRSFYTSLGHEGAAFQDDTVKRHVAAGIMWAVRREAEFVQ